ncbi:MAG: hypothetical protein ABEI86_13850 [Halobacteriaceae archaeon]
MTDKIGKTLTEVSQGEVITVIVADDRYKGEVIEINRQKCNLVAGFMEDGYIGVKIKAEEETIERHELPTDYLLVSATEDVPRSWKDPRVSVYNSTDGETADGLGTVTEIRFGSD